MPDNIYRKQVELLLRILPSIMREEVFVLKGGTAINFFWRDYPRLSVDIDLAYIKIQQRDLSLLDISNRLESIKVRLERFFPGINIEFKKEQNKGLAYALIIRYEDATVKVEVNTVMRGNVYPTTDKKLCNNAEKEFELSVTTKTLSFEDLYAGKICAALDRQHPRDLFDIKLLFENEGLTEKIRKALIVYLISHSRPIVEVLNPGLKDINKTFEQEFTGMTVQEVKLPDLLEVRSALIKEVKKALTGDEKKFLLSFKNRHPERKHLNLDGINKLPAVKWKIINLARMKPELHKKAYEKLEKYLLD